MTPARAKTALASLLALALSAAALSADEAVADETAAGAAVADEIAVAVEAPEGFVTTVSGGFSFEAYDPLGGGGRWRTNATGTLGLAAKRGNEFSLDMQVEVPCTGDALAADVIDVLAFSWSPAPVVMLTAGKQNLKWGTARVFSSIEKLAPPIDPLDPQQSRRGITGVRADIIPTWWLSFSAVAIPSAASGGYLDETTLAARAEILAGETDLSAGGISCIDLDGSRETAFFMDFARFFDRFGVYGETQIIAKASPLAAATGGVQIDIPVWLDGTATFLCEYRWTNDDAKAGHQGYAGFSGIPLGRRVNLALSLLAAPEADQAVIGASLGWKIRQGFVASLGWKGLQDWSSAAEPLVPLYTQNRQSVEASVSVWY